MKAVLKFALGCSFLALSIKLMLISKDARPTEFEQIGDPNVVIVKKSAISMQQLSKEVVNENNALNGSTLTAVTEIASPPPAIPEHLTSQDLAPPRPSFMERLTKLPWDDFKNGYTRAHSVQLINFLSEYIIMEPKFPINESCSAPPLLQESEIKCDAYPNAFNGKRREKPAKIAHIIQLGFDIDVLEIHLREIIDVVDHFFILESTAAQYQLVKKPLMWEQVRLQKRFAPFLDKVVHLIMDDVEVLRHSQGDGTFTAEYAQERRRWTKFLEWNEKTGYYSDEDIVGFGDTDEVSSRKNLQLLKHCDIDGPVDIGIWFPYGQITKAFTPDYPVPGHRFTLGDPTYWKLSAAKQFPDYPGRQRGRSGRYLVGGMHLTAHRYLPFLIIKDVTCSECGITVPKINRYLEYINGGDTLRMELGYDRVNMPDRLLDIKGHEDELRDIVVIPWFLDCNHYRYPYWYDLHDKRLD